jgi:alpha-tubulin suppressor-like RCC1 family protein
MCTRRQRSSHVLERAGGRRVGGKTPTPVDLPTGVRQIVVGEVLTCALDAGGGVWCWGSRTGNADFPDSLAPVQVDGLSSGVQAIAVGQAFACAVTSSGGVKCWGDAGALGDGSGEASPIPVQVSGLTSGVRTIGAGRFHACAVLTDGHMRCWGRNDQGQLGDGTTDDRLTPVEVSDVSGATSVSAGEFGTCAVVDGGAECWGANVGDGTTNRRNTPGLVSGLSSGVQEVSVGTTHSCALVADGTAECWGDNDYGQLGDGTQTMSYVPVKVMGLGGKATAVAAGWWDTCAIASERLRCWGNNHGGGLGVGPPWHTRPMDVLGLSSGVSDSAGNYYDTCAAKAGGAVACWGLNWNEGGPDFVSLPTPVTGFAGPVSTLISGWAYFCALTVTGGAECWGSNDSGELGDGGYGDGESAPVPVKGLDRGVSSITGGGAHSCAVTAEGAAMCWGNNQQDQLGTSGGDTCTNDLGGTWDCSPVPVQVEGLSSGVKEVAAGSSHSCALLTSGAVKCWGKNDRGQLGDGTRTSPELPVDVQGLTGVVSIAAGGDDTCAVLSTGAVKCWGSNGHGELGDGTKGDRLTPTSVVGLGDVKSITTNSYGGESTAHTCALTSGGSVKCWGANSVGELGDRSQVERLTPVDVAGLSSGVASISAGAGHTCAVTEASAMKCWGSDNYAQLGDGKGTNYLFPQNVIFAPPPAPKTLTIQVTGPGTVFTKPPGIACPSTCVHAFIDSVSVELVAVPDEGAGFLGWSGECEQAGSYPHCSISMSQNKTIAAFFEHTCTVPRVVGMPLRQAHWAIQGAHCSLGTLRHKHSRKFKIGTVIWQRPFPHTTLHQDGTVNLTLSRGPRHRR